MENREQNNGVKTCSISANSENLAEKVISIEECKQYIGKYNLSDEKIDEIRNYLIGMVDKSINSYLNEFRQ